MISIRKGVFETNSSSVHTIVIQKDPPKNIHPIKIQEDDYGWGLEFLQTPEERASYFYTALCDCGEGLDEPVHDARLKMMSLLPKDIRYECKFENGEDCYIDHCDDLLPWLQDLIDDNDKFLRFIYGDKSYVRTGNDNTDYDDFEYPEEGIQDNGSEVFIKGN